MKPSVQDKLVFLDANSSHKHSAMKQKLREKSQEMAFEFGLDKPFLGSFGKLCGLLPIVWSRYTLQTTDPVGDAYELYCLRG